jgi:2-amino-4-hydroxy-6-hydroxymethyldihydropteridine diphosphokinase
MTRAVLALGANLGDARAAVEGAMDALDSCEGVTVVARSSLYVTDPVGGPEQPQFINAIVIVETSLDPVQLLACAHEVEHQWHRTREVHWGPRTLDIDVIDIPGVRMNTTQLMLPHPRAAERAFVLVPWLEVDSAAQITGLGSVSTLLEGVDRSGISPMGEP